MANMLRKGMMYGVLLAAGITLGMQMSDPGSAGSGRTEVVLPNGMWTSESWQNTVSYGVPAQPTQPSSQIPNEQAPVNSPTAPWPNDQIMQTPADLLTPPIDPPAVDRFADKAAGLLQQVSKKGIHWIASLFGPSTE